MKETDMQIGVPRATLSIEAIQEMLNAGVACAKALDVKVHITIMDHAANLAGFISFPGAPRIAETTANRKAFTAVNTGMPTHLWEAYVNSIPPSELKIIDSISGYIAAKGGYPIIEGDLVLGSIGVSGANQKIDGEIAEAALAAIGVPGAL
jgi:glc operon protein GlcG